MASAGFVVTSISALTYYTVQIGMLHKLNASVMCGRICIYACVLVTGQKIYLNIANICPTKRIVNYR
jgi:hypothetical protein